MSQARVLVSEFLPGDLAAFAGLVGGGVGQEGVSEGAPPGPAVGQGGDDERGFVVKFVLTIEGV
jgi:hypothetical protein